MYCKFLWFDVRQGLLRCWKKLLAACAVMLCLLLLHCLLIYTHNTTLPPSEAALGFTTGDLLASVLCGIPPYDPVAQQPFLFPAIWLLFFLLLLYQVLLYPMENLNGIGQTMLMLSKSRRVWWLSKCSWCALYVLVYFALFYALAALLTLAAGGEVTLALSSYYPSLWGVRNELQPPPWDTLPFFLLAPCIACALALAQATATLWMRPIFAFFASCLYWLASSYFLSPLLLGNYAMMQRIQTMVSDGLPCLSGLVSAALLCVCCLALGCWRSARMDILTFDY